MWFQNFNIKHLPSSALKIFYHSKSTGVHLGLVTKLIESDIFLSGFWDPPSCQSAPILFAFPLILLLLRDERWAPLTSKTCLKHSLAFRIKVRAACQGCIAMHWHGKAAMTASQWQKLNMTITVWIFVLNLQSNLQCGWLFKERIMNRNEVQYTLDTQEKIFKLNELKKGQRRFSEYCVVL